MTGAYATHGRQHIDFDTTQEHAAPNTTSDLAFRGVLQGRSSAVWKGNIIVDPGAQKTDAFQESRNLLISKRAHADAIPGLEIQANDVRCTHAAAVAQVDPEQLFYLRSHGLPEESRQAAGDRGLPRGARRALRAGAGARGAGRRARAPARADPRRLGLHGRSRRRRMRRAMARAAARWSRSATGSSSAPTAIYALVPLEGPDRGDGRRTLVHVEGIAEPLIASRSEGAIAHDMAVALGQEPPRRRDGGRIPGQDPLVLDRSSPCSQPG